MKKSNLIKLFSILTISVMVVMFTTNVMAATNDTIDLTNTIGNNSSNNANTNANTNKSNTNTNNANKANSVYNNTNLPKTGIEDSIPVAMLVVVFGVSAVYAYKKIKDYRNI